MKPHAPKSSPVAGAPLSPTDVLIILRRDESVVVSTPFGDLLARNVEQGTKLRAILIVNGFTENLRTHLITAKK